MDIGARAGFVGSWAAIQNKRESFASLRLLLAKSSGGRAEQQWLQPPAGNCPSADQVNAQIHKTSGEKTGQRQKSNLFSAKLHFK